MKKKLKLNNKNTTIFLFLFVLFVFFIGTGFNVAKHLGDILLNKGSSESIQEDDNMISQPIGANGETSEEKAGNIVTKIFSLINKGITLVETMYDEYTIFRSELIYINGGFQLLLNQRIIEDADKVHTVYKLKNGQLTFKFSGNDMTGNLENMKELYDFICSKDMRLLYIQAPFKVNKYDNKMPGGIEDTTNMIADDLIEGLRNYEIPYIDLRDMIYGSGLDYDDLFYFTDHHWKVETAFWAYGNVMNYLAETYDIQYDIKTAELSNFKKIFLEKSFLGAQGVRVGRLYGGIDDFSYYIPDFHTDYFVQIFNIDGSIRSESKGEFQDSIIVKEIVDKDNQIETERFQAYFGGDRALIKIVNLEQQNGKLLIIKDSFARPFTAFMSLNFKETDVIDLRYFHNMTLYDYLESNQYDLIIFLYNPSELNSGELFTFK
jgi:hypothetical protein